MPLPDDPKQEFPPKTESESRLDYAEASAWYSGDPVQLATFYGTTDTETPSKRIRFWARRKTEDGRRMSASERIHVPAAGDIAATSADYIFGFEPKLTVSAASDRVDEVQARLLEIADELEVYSTLIEAAEVASGLGGVILRVGWDRNVRPGAPLLDVVHPDFCIPSFSYGVLTGVTIWRELEKRNGKVFRHLERHELVNGRGVILHGLYLGDEKAGTLGRKLDLSTHELTAGLESEVVILPNNFRGLAVRYIPNIRPNRKRRGSSLGRPDTTGVTSLLDSLDETMSAWMRDIRLAKARLIVPDEFLDRTGRGKGAEFDVDREVFASLNIDPLTSEKTGITASQFDIRSAEHSETAASLLRNIYQAAGYSPQTFGLDIEGQAESGTALRQREAKSLRTTEKKRRYFLPAVQDTLFNLQVIDAAVFESGLEPLPVTVVPGEFGSPSLIERATAVDLLKRAQSATTRLRVQIANPDLEGDALDAEVAGILEEEGMTVPDPTGGFS